MWEVQGWPWHCTISPTLWNGVIAGDMIMDGFVLFPGTNNCYVPPESTSHEMYFLVVIFHLKATSSPLSLLVFMSQIVVYATKLNVPLHMYIDVQPSRNI